MQLDRFKFALDISPVPMLLASNNGEILLANDLLNQLFEYESAELAGKNVDILVPEGTRQRHPELRDAYFHLPSKRQMGQGRDLSGVTRTGEVIPLELGLDSVIIEGEVYALVVAVDIRQRKLHDERMNLSMDASASAMIMVDTDGLVVFVNKAAIALFGYEEAELLNRPIEQLVPQEVRHVHPAFRDGFTTSSKTRPMAKEKNLFALHREGHRIPVEIALTPVETPDGKMVVSIIIDLSERVAAAAAASRRSKELTRVNHELSQFAYSASHDLKAPLSSIVGLLHLCLEDLEDGNNDEVRTNLERCLQISARSAKKIENVLEIARIGRDNFESSSVSLTQLIQDAWMDLIGINKHNIQLLLGLRHVDPIFIEPKTFKVILENLLSNAIRYGDENKSEHFIKVETHIDEANFHLVVSDNGIGIPSEKKHAVFNMFTRIDERSEDGLGMALVKKHIDNLGGTIAFTSTQGDGTTFNVTLPLHRKD